jgi:hypothetical protein
VCGECRCDKAGGTGTRAEEKKKQESLAEWRRQAASGATTRWDDDDGRASEDTTEQDQTGRTATELGREGGRVPDLQPPSLAWWVRWANKAWSSRRAAGTYHCSLTSRYPPQAGTLHSRSHAHAHARTHRIAAPTAIKVSVAMAALLANSRPRQLPDLQGCCCTITACGNAKSSTRALITQDPVGAGGMRKPVHPLLSVELCVCVCVCV